MLASGDEKRQRIACSCEVQLQWSFSLRTWSSMIQSQVHNSARAARHAGCCACHLSKIPCLQSMTRQGIHGHA
eukprot:6425623-Amphidinium_carterae.1